MSTSRYHILCVVVHSAFCSLLHHGVTKSPTLMTLTKHYIIVQSSNKIKYCSKLMWKHLIRDVTGFFKWMDLFMYLHTYKILYCIVLWKSNTNVKKTKNAALGPGNNGVYSHKRSMPMIIYWAFPFPWQSLFIIFPWPSLIWCVNIRFHNCNN